MQNRANQIQYAPDPNSINGVISAPVEDQRKFSEFYVLTGRVLGSGGQAKVLSGKKIESRRKVAIKVANSKHLDGQMNIV